VKPVGDRIRLFTLALAWAWLLLVALPLVASVELRWPAQGLPLLGVGIWFVVLRLARWFTPSTHCDRLLRAGSYARALELCERELAVQGPYAWHGTRRVAWLNRRTNALLGVGRLSEALVSALDALGLRPDPETLANCALCLLRLNRYDEAAGAARLALSLTRERSVSANATLANVLLAHGQPAEAQAAAQAGLADIEALLPLVQPAHHAALLAALCRADRALEDDQALRTHLAALRRLAARHPALQAVALLEEADDLAGGEQRERARAFALFEEAIALAPHYAWWFIGQPYALHELRSDPRFALLTQRARTDWLLKAGAPSVPPDQGAPPPTYVTMELATAQRRGYARPGARISRAGLAAQVLTLAGTFALLLWWTWHFFLAGS
jgi:tetratricopeptide (TPR) repeat protein